MLRSSALKRRDNCCYNSSNYFNNSSNSKIKMITMMDKGGMVRRTVGKGIAVDVDDAYFGEFFRFWRIWFLYDYDDDGDDISWLFVKTMIYQRSLIANYTKSRVYVCVCCLDICVQKAIEGVLSFPSRIQNMYDSGYLLLHSSTLSHFVYILYKSVMPMRH